MRFLLEPLFNPDQTAELRSALLSEQAIWEDGSLSAGIYTKASKNNLQLDRETPLFDQLQANVVEAMLAHPLVRSAALPLSLHSGTDVAAMKATTETSKSSTDDCP
jgi:PKHD-type hydroxylase